MNLSPFKLERFFAKYEFNVKHLLGASDCESLTINELLALEPGATERFQQQWLGYTESAGSPSLRAEIAAVYTSIQPDQVLVHSGAEEAILLFLQATLQTGDHVIVHWPCYQSLNEVARATGADVTHWEARFEHNWALDLAELRRAIRPNTKVIIVNTPHNPTGFLMSHSDWSEIHRIADQHGIILFCDEVYRESELDPADCLRAGCDMSPRAVSLGVMSKSYGLPGLRIGWIATHNHEVYENMAHLKDYTTICNSAPSEFLAEVGLRHRHRLTARNIEIVRHNLALLDSFFAHHADRITWVRPKAGAITFPRLLKGEIEDFAHRLVTQAGVLLVPGTIFEHPGNHFRLGFGRKNFGEGLEVLGEFLELGE